MKMIKPIVNISKIISNYELIIVGLEGVVSEGGMVRPEAADALINFKRNGKRIIMIANSPLSIEAILLLLKSGGIPAPLFDNIVSAGEIMHYKLKFREGDFANIGTTYFNIGNAADSAIFSWLDYMQVGQLPKADFMFMGSVKNPEDNIEEYLPILEHAVNLNIPLVCVGNDTSSFMKGQICLAPGAIAEQYVAMGGRIITIGKPDPAIFQYAVEGIQGIDKEQILIIGDNITTDIKGASLLGVPSVLVSKGVHVNFLGEGYIPDVAKTREIANNYDAYPDYVISNLRW